jgi:hypothetical protein
MYQALRHHLECYGTQFVAHASPAVQTLEEVASGWYHARSAISRILTEKYRCLLYAGWSLASSDIAHDVDLLLGGHAIA